MSAHLRLVQPNEESATDPFPPVPDDWKEKELPRPALPFPIWPLAPFIFALGYLIGTVLR